MCYSSKNVADYLGSVLCAAGCFQMLRAVALIDTNYKNPEDNLNFDLPLAADAYSAQDLAPKQYATVGRRPT